MLAKASQVNSVINSTINSIDSIYRNNLSKLNELYVPLEMNQQVVDELKNQCETKTGLVYSDCNVITNINGFFVLKRQISQNNISIQTIFNGFLVIRNDLDSLKNTVEGLSKNTLDAETEFRESLEYFSNVLTEISRFCPYNENKRIYREKYEIVHEITHYDYSCLKDFSKTEFNKLDNLVKMLGSNNLKLTTSYNQLKSNLYKELSKY